MKQKNIGKELLDHLKKLECDNYFTETWKFLKSKKMNKFKINRFLRLCQDNGAFCDCEILRNLEEHIIIVNLP